MFGPQPIFPALVQSLNSLSLLLVETSNVSVVSSVTAGINPHQEKGLHSLRLGAR